MGTLTVIGLMLLALSILIVVHEAGHFWAARMFGIKVEKFYLFFDWKFKLFSFKKGDTEYGIGWIPLGGYVKIAGMLDESMDEEALKQPAQPWEFRSKPIWQRLIVMLGGIIMNVILGILIFIGHRFFYGQDIIPMSNVSMGIHVQDSSAIHGLGFRTGDKLLTYCGDTLGSFNEYADPNLLVDRGKYFEVEHIDGRKETIHMPDDFINAFQADTMKVGSYLFMPDMPAILKVASDTTAKAILEANPEADTAKNYSIQAFYAGIRTGDKVVRADSTPIERYSQFQAYMRHRPNTTVTLGVERAGKPLEFKVFTKANSRIGVVPYLDVLNVHKEYGFLEAIPAGTKAAFLQIPRTLKGLRAVGSGNANARKSMSGPIGIAQQLGNSFATNGWEGFWAITALLSMVLAVMNLLPIPVLDGGHVLILCIEGIIGRELPMKLKEIIMWIGFILVLALMAFVIGNDIIKMIFG